MVIFFVAVLAFILKDHIYNSVLSTYILSQTSYRITAEEWLNKNLKGPAVFATYTSNPRTQRNDIRVIDLPQLTAAFGYREFVEEKYDYALIDFFKIQERNFWWMLLPPRMPTQFWSKPDDLLSQNYLALATRELLWEHTIKGFLLKWQASGYNYAVTEIKFPAKFGENVLLAKFNFTQENDWVPLSFLKHDKNKLFWRMDGRKNPGAIGIKRGREPGKGGGVATIPGGLRWESPTLSAKPGFGYKVKGWVKNDDYIEKEFRNGFLRLDFYKENQQTSITARPIISFVSARPYGRSQWYEVEMEGVAPAESNFLKIGFQADDSSVTVVLDEVEVYETKERVLKTETEHFVIPDEDFFRPSDSSFT